MSAARAVLAVLVVAAMGCAILGIGMGEAPAEREPEPSADAVRTARERIAAGGPDVRRGERLFAEQGCDRCHSIAAIGAEGKLGPRLDASDDLEDNFESIEDPRDDTAEGYPEQLMPEDFDERLSNADLLALALFVTAAADGDTEVEDEDEDEREDDGGRSPNRGRGGGYDG